MGKVSPTVRIVVIVLAALAVVGLVAYARGLIHHRGWFEIGSHGMAAVAPAVPGRG